MTENPATLIESGFASRASTHKKKNKSQTSQKFDSCSLHSLGQLPMRADESESVVSRFCNLKVPRKQPQFTECNTGLQNTTGWYFSSPNATQGCKNTTGSSWPLLRTTLWSIRQSAVSGRASSSFTSVGGNTSASRPAPSASWPPQTPSIASALKARYLMVLTVPSDLSRARHRPGLHSEMAAIRPSHRARSSTTGPGESRQVFVPLELSSELCPSPNLLGRSGWVRKSSTAARYTLSANSRCEQMKANRLFPGFAT
jgi:hypothetical protein